MEMPSPLIRIETARTIMSDIMVDHAPVMYEMNQDPLVIQYTGDGPFASLEATQNFIRQYDQYQKYQVGRLAIVLKQDQTCIGWCGLKYDAESKEYDIGFRLLRAYWNQGYATETALASLAYGFNTLGLNRIVGRAMTANTASVQVLRKIGMSYLQDFNFDNQPGMIYALDRTDYIRQQT